MFPACIFYMHISCFLCLGKPLAVARSPEVSNSLFISNQFISFSLSPFFPMSTHCWYMRDTRPNCSQ